MLTRAAFSFYWFLGVGVCWHFNSPLITLGNNHHDYQWLAASHYCMGAFQFIRTDISQIFRPSYARDSACTVSVKTDEATKRVSILHSSAPIETGALDQRCWEQPWKSNSQIRLAETCSFKTNYSTSLIVFLLNPVAFSAKGEDEQTNITPTPKRCDHRCVA